MAWCDYYLSGHFTATPHHFLSCSPLFSCRSSNTPDVPSKSRFSHKNCYFLPLASSHLMFSVSHTFNTWSPGIHPPAVTDIPISDWFAFMITVIITTHYSQNCMLCRRILPIVYCLSSLHGWWTRIRVSLLFIDPPQEYKTVQFLRILTR